MARLRISAASSIGHGPTRGASSGTRVGEVARRYCRHIAVFAGDGGRAGRAGGADLGRARQLSQIRWTFARGMTAARPGSLFRRGRGVSPQAPGCGGTGRVWCWRQRLEQARLAVGTRWRSTQFEALFEGLDWRRVYMILFCHGARIATGVSVAGRPEVKLAFEELEGALAEAEEEAPASTARAPRPKRPAAQRNSVICLPTCRGSRK